MGHLPAHHCTDTRRIADSGRTRRRIPGLVYAVMNADSILLMEGVGYRHSAPGTPVRFQIVSHRLGRNLLYLVCRRTTGPEGKLKWNTPLLQLVPSAAPKCRSEFRGITLADLPVAAAGLVNMNEFREIYSGPPLSGKPVQQRIQFWSGPSSEGASAIPRAGNHFASFPIANTIAAVAMLEKASGQPWNS